MLEMILPAIYPPRLAPKPPTSVVVKAGDTLSKISREFGDDLAKLLGWNPEVTASDPSGNLIYPGERIAVAADGSHSPVSAYGGRHRATGSSGVSAALSGPGTAPPAPASPAPSSASGSHFDPSGQLTPSEVGELWLEAGGPAWAEGQSERVAMCESTDDTRAYNPSGASGLFQILGGVVPGDLFDAYVNAENAVSKFEASGDTWAQWVCQP